MEKSETFLLHTQLGPVAIGEVQEEHLVVDVRLHIRFFGVLFVRIGHPSEHNGLILAPPSYTCRKDFFTTYKNIFTTCTAKIY